MDEHIRSFNLRRWFSGLSLIVILLIGSLSAYVLSEFLSQTLIQRDAQVTMEMMESVLQSKTSLNYLQGLGSTAAVDPTVGHLEDFFGRLALLSSVIRANIYSLDRHIIWSNNPQLIGQHFPVNPELDRALEGNLTVNLESVEEMSKEEHQRFGPDIHQFIEYYLPIHGQGDKTIVAVVELYKLPRLLLEDISRGTLLIWSSALIGAAVLYLTLFWIVYRASRLINQQHQALVESEGMTVVGEMVAMIAHRIRNPLAAIRSSAELLQDDRSLRRWETATDITTEVDRLESWIKELLVYAQQPKEGDQQICDLRELFAGCLDQLKDQFEHYHIDAQWRLADGVSYVREDPKQLAQVLIILMTNAIEAMPLGGRLIVSGKPAGTRVLIKVTDSGSGIPTDQLKTVFNPLQSQKRDGLGMGLPLARRVLQHCQRTVELTSKAGAGTVAWVNLEQTEPQ